MDPRSEAYLAHVHPALAGAARAAAQVPQPWTIVYGVRTLDAEKQACASGHSTTMHSRHLPSEDGLCRAFDVAVLVDGKISFAPGHEAEMFGAVAEQIKAAAANLSVPLEWGGDWKTFKDWGHFQLPWKDFP